MSTFVKRDYIDGEDFDPITNSEKARKEFGYNYGYEIYRMSRDDIDLLLKGKMLATTINDGEYSIFIELKEEE